MLHEEITEKILSAAMKVHTALGAGCLESTYDACLRYQLQQDGIRFDHQVRLPVFYNNVQVDAGYRIDFLVEDCVIVELKAVLINFNVPHLRQGIKRIIHGYRGRGG